MNRSSVMLAFLALLVAFFHVASGGLFLTPINVTNLVFQGSYLIVLAPAMLLVMVTGRLDLSIGGIVAFSGAVLSVLLLRWDVPVLLAVGIVLLLGAAIGALQGYLIAELRIPMFITTLSGMMVWRGLTLAILGGETRAPLDPDLSGVVTGFLPPWGVLVAGAVIVAGVLARVGRTLRGRVRGGSLLGWTVAAAAAILLLRYRGIPAVALIVTVPAVATALVLERTVFGRHLYALGAAPGTARLSGVRTRRVLLLAYLNNGLMAAVAGLIVAGRLNAVTAKAGNLFEIDAITACLIGGASMVGGVGRIGPVLLAAVIIAVLNNGLSLAGIGGEGLIKAAIMLSAGYLDVLAERGRSAT